MFLQVNTFVMLNEKFENLMRNLKINTRRAMQRIKFHICEGKYNFVFLEIPRKFICSCYVERQDFAITVFFFNRCCSDDNDGNKLLQHHISGAMLLYKVCYFFFVMKIPEFGNKIRLHNWGASRALSMSWPNNFNYQIYLYFLWLELFTYQNYQYFSCLEKTILEEKIFIHEKYRWD